jgi:hypothetical protein
MFQVNEDNSIYATRGDVVFFSVTAEDNGLKYKFQPGDVVRFTVYGKKDAENVVLQKDFPVAEVCESVYIHLNEEDTRIGKVISKPTDYWYEVELNPDTQPQTIIGYDEDGAKVFKLFPEGEEIGSYEPVPEDFPVVDNELDMTSPRPVSNAAVAAAIANITDVCERTNAAVAENFVTPEMFGAVGDGVADDTEAIQAALEASNKVMFGYGKTYLVNCENSSAVMSLRSGTLVDFNYSTVKLAPTNKGVYHIVNLSNENCTIKNGTLIGDKNEHTGTEEEHGQCVTIRGKNIELINMTMMRGWGDGVFIGKKGDVEPENVRMYNCKCLENRRNGMSIGAGKNIHVDRCAFNYSYGTAPQSGFDVEPGEDGEISVFMDNIECIGNGNSPFCLANRHSTNCRVYIGKIFTEGSVIYIRSPEKSSFHINDLYHVSKSASGVHLVGGENTHITIDSLTLDMSDEACLRGLYTEGVYDCTIGELAILGDKADFLANADNFNINIGRLAYSPVVPAVSLSKTNINIDSVARKTEVITATNKQPKMFVSEITFDGSETITATIFCRNYPNEFTLKAYNPTTVSHDIYCDDGKIVNGTTENSRITLEPGKMVELRYYKTAGKWVVKSLF